MRIQDHLATGSDAKTEADSAPIRIRSPKRTPGTTKNSRAAWFPYYAGFSAGFVEDTIDQLDLKTGAVILDPWLGAGTTSEIATAKGFQVRGYDLNPAMLLVARARLLPSGHAKDVASALKRIHRVYERGVHGPEIPLETGFDDPLEQWLQPASARMFRHLESTVAKATDSNSYSSATPIWKAVGQAPPIVALLYVGLFRTLRHFISKFQSSNPTWVKVSKGNLRIQLTRERIYNRFLREVGYLQAALNSESRPMPSVGKRRCVITQASSMKLPLSSNSVDAVLSSPPYCTRIDYVRATLPELAIIRFPNGQSIRHLREQMIGTPTISKHRADHDLAWGVTCNQFLVNVENHSSKASSTYYIKYFRQYFASAFTSLRQIDRVLVNSGQCMLVVQDSYYKDVQNDLPTVFCEMVQHHGWNLEQKIDFPVKRTFAGINPNVKPYRKEFHAVESALFFRKEA